MWYQVEFTEPRILGGAYHRLCRTFQQRFIVAGAPPDMALFATLGSFSDTRRVYLTPGSLPYVQELIDLFGGSPCDGPCDEEVAMVYGVPGAEQLLNQTAKAA